MACAICTGHRDALAHLLTICQIVVRTIACERPAAVFGHMERAVGAWHILRHHHSLTCVRICNHQLTAGVQGRGVIAFAHRHCDRTHSRQIVRTRDRNIQSLGNRRALSICCTNSDDIVDNLVLRQTLHSR